MEVLSELPVIGTLLTVVLPFVIVLGVVVFVHEYGHYIVGRWCGIRAETFSIGFGPRLYAWRDRRGTSWQVAALPLGGFVKFVGDMDPASAGKADGHLSPEERREAFHNASLPRRAATVAAGPVFNFALTILLYIALAFVIGAPKDDPVIGDVAADAPAGVTFEPGDRVISMGGEPVESYAAIIDRLREADGEAVTTVVERDGARTTIEVSYPMSPEVQFVRPGMPASQAGMAPGDRIVSINGEKVTSFRDIQLATADLPLDEPIAVVVERDGQRRTFEIVPEAVTRPHPVTGEEQPLPTLGVSALGTGGIEPTRGPVDPVTAVVGGFAKTWLIVDRTLGFMGDLIFADADSSQLGGPIRIAQLSGEQAQAGLLEFVGLIALLSTSIGLINLFPIPVLDGGHLMFYAIEALRGRPVGESAMRLGTAVGLSLVLLLMVFATYNDIARIL